MFNLHDLDELMDTQQDTGLQPIQSLTQALAPQYDLDQPIDSIQQMDTPSQSGFKVLPKAFDVGVRKNYTDEELEKILNRSGKRGKDSKLS